MKKLIATTLFVAMIFCCIPAQAAQKPSLDFLNFTYVDHPNINQSGVMEFKLNKPLLCLEAVEQMADEYDELDSYDIKKIAEGLFDSKMFISSKLKAENGGKKIAVETHMKSQTPLVINNNLTIAANANTSVWMDIDLGTQAGIDYIMSVPYGSKYMLMNTKEIADYMEDESVSAAFDSVKNMLSAESMSAINQKNIESIYKNANVSGSSRNVKITFTDIGFKKYMGDIFAMTFEMMGENPYEDYGLEGLVELMAKVPFFADEAVVMEYTLDSRGRITKQKSQINVDLNLYELIAAMGLEPDGLTPENSDICFSINSEYDCTYATVKIEKPEITEANSINMADSMTIPEEEYYPEEDYVYYDRYPFIEVDNLFLNSGNNYYIPLRNVLEAYDYEVAYADGVISATSDHVYAEYDYLEFTLGDVSVNTSQGIKELGSAPVLVDGRTYIRMFDAEILLNSRADSYNNNFGYYQYLNFYRLNDEFDIWY